MEQLKLEKLYYTIGEVADMFEVSTSLIRYWEGEFPSIKPAKNRRGERKFVLKDIEQIKLIYNLVKERGFTLEGAKKELQEMKSNSQDAGEDKILKKLQSLKKNLLELKNSI